METLREAIEKPEEILAIERFRRENPGLFKREDRRLFVHLGIVLGPLIALTGILVSSPSVPLKILAGMASAFLWFCLINVTIHHHLTHHNATDRPFAKKFLDFLYLAAVPNAPKRKARYSRAHLNHHARPFHETDIDHHYGTKRYLDMKKRFLSRILYFLELTFVGGHVPGWEDDRYMNQVPLEQWNQRDYEKVKEREQKEAFRTSLIQWGLFLAAVPLVPAIAWGWAFPMLLVKNWAHYLGQFQHYDEDFLDPSRSVWNRTKTYHFPGWLNYLAGGEISGHFLHHLYPELPYYNVERARRRFVNDPELRKIFIRY